MPIKKTIMKIKINIKKEVKDILLSHQSQPLPTDDSLIESLKKLFELHLSRVTDELLDKTAFGTIHIHTGEPHQFH